MGEVGIMRKGILVTILIILPLIMSINPVVANSETIVTGGGIIIKGQGKDANRIMFRVNISTDEEGIPSTGILQINFLNTHYDFIGNDNFDKCTFITTDIITERSTIETRNNPTYGDYTFVRIVAYGELNGEDGWLTETRFAVDFDESGYGKSPDAVRISLFNPDDEHVYDTAAGVDGYYDFSRDHSWRTILNGDVTIFYYE
jgi:hypothetical protein